MYNSRGNGKLVRRPKFGAKEGIILIILLIIMIVMIITITIIRNNNNK